MRLSEKDYENSLAHYGILRKSGRYPWGSGDTPLQRSKSFLDITKDLRKNHGMSDAQIAKSFSTKEHPFSVNDLRALNSRSVTLVKQDQIRTAQRLRDKGMGPSAIARQMSTPDNKVNESTVRSLLEPGRLEYLDITQTTANMLKRQVEEKGFIDVGAHVERDLPIGDNPSNRVGISADKFKTALSILKEEGYSVHPYSQKQMGTGEYTKYQILVKPGVTKHDVFLNRHKISQIAEKSDDGGKTFQDMSLKPPLNISSKRVAVKYKEDGGAEADGVIFVRPGVKDISLGKSNYAQVRIAIDDSHYLKGMAVYKDDLPKGVDLLFNTNKSDTGNKLDAMKPFKKNEVDGKVDPVNPFGAAIKIGGQIKENGKVVSAMNLVNEEGDWDKWSRTLSRQVLSKQSPELAKSQLDMTYERRLAEFEEIKSLTNPLVKKKLLESFSNDTDAAAVHLKAANMPRQATKVILPSTKVKPTEIFAPTFEDGERVALIRFPHAGLFEIPELTVNSRSRDVKKLVGLGKGGIAPDVVVVHPKVALRLSGADFDGDHVVVIPNRRGTIQTKPPLDQLKGFDPQQYKVPLGPKTKKFPDGAPTITPAQKQQEMGNVTNLIADMTIRGANSDELARAVKHSMVVIDSEKHNLDYKASERDHTIRELKKRYQGVWPSGQLKGASTLITRATAEKHVVKRKARLASEGGPIDPKTGKKMYTPTGERKKILRPDSMGGPIDPKTGKKVYIETDDFATFPSKRLAETDDAFTLVSEGRGYTIERVYAEHSNRLKSLANEARLEFLHTEVPSASPSAKKVYAKEVESLKSKLDTALRNAPRERQAQVVAEMLVSQRRRANPNMEKETLKKIRGQALNEARVRTGAGKTRLGSTDSPITAKEWEAIQAGALSKKQLGDILKNADLDVIRKLATPRENPVMSSIMTRRAKAMLNSGATPAEVADALGVPVSTLKSGVSDD